MSQTLRPVVSDNIRVDPNRVPPHNIEAEESLLGAMLLSRDAIASAVELVKSDDFYKPAHGNIFDAICSLYSQGEPADPVTVADELRRANLLDISGGASTLISLQSNTPAITNASRYASIVEEHALLRKLISVASEIAEMGYALPDDVADAIDRAETMVFDVASRRVTDSLAPIKELLELSLDRLETLYEKGDTITGVPTGFNDLDNQLAGLQNSNLIVVGARPAMGKCVAYDTPMVDPKTGDVISIEELHKRGSNGEDVEIISVRDDHRMYRGKPSHFIDDGIKPVYRVRTGMGREITTTMSHPFLTPGGWRALADLAPGALVGVPRSFSVFGNEILSPNHVVLLAYLLGESALTLATPRFSGISGEILSDIRYHVGEMHAELEADVVLGDPDTYRVEVPSGQRNVFLDLAWKHNLLGVTPHERKVPDVVYRLAKNELALFLNRLLASGGSTSWNEDDFGDVHAYIFYRTVSKDIARAAQHLLLRFGINAAIRRSVIDFRGERQLGYELLISNHDEIIRFVDEIDMFGHTVSTASIAARLIALRKEQNDERNHDSHASGPWPMIIQEKGNRSWGEMADDLGIQGEAMHPAGVAIAQQSAEALASWRRSDILWDEIVAIDYDGEQQVYDLTVPGDHNFVASDVFVHNTSFALNICAHAAMEQKVPVLLFSLEMSHLEVTQRLLCSEARVDATRMRNGRLLENDWTKISNAVGRLGEAPIYIDDNPNITIMDIRAKSRRMKARDGLGLVVIDYLQLLSGRNNAESRQVEVSELSRGLKILARELDVPVIALSQLSRNLENRSDKRPILADLRESGSIEQDSDVVMFLYRDEIYNPDSPDRGVAEVIVSKHRNGPTGSTRLAFLDHYTRFANMANRPSA